MGYKTYKIKYKTDELRKLALTEFRKHHPEFDQIPISRDKIVYEAFRIYLEVK